MERLTLLVDTNVFLEALLEQEKTEIVRIFFKATDPDRLPMMGPILKRKIGGQASEKHISSWEIR